MQATLTKAQETPSARAPAPDGKTALLRRARGTLLLALGAFVLSQVGLRVFIDEVKPELRDPTFEIKYRQLARLLEQYPQPPAAVVFLGSSMSANGMKAEIVEAPLTAALGRPVVGYNLATNGGGPITHLVYMQRLLRRGVRPELVVLEVSPLLFAPGQASMDFLRFPADVLERADIDILERHRDLPELRDEWWKARLFPAYGHRLMILNQSARILVPFEEQIELWRDVDEHGWRGRTALPPEEHERALAHTRLVHKERLAKFKIDELPLNGLRELAALLAQEGIKTVLVVMPTGPFMCSLYVPGSTAPVMAEFAALSQQHGFALIDARDWYDEGSFLDSYHLHKDAAHEFTQRLVREALVPAAGSHRGVASRGR
jgi:Protein of unknown function (DUF1574)